MTVQITRSKTIINKFDGTKEEKESVHCEVQCNGPKCGKPDSACPSTMEWTESRPEDVPDSFFRMILFKVGNDAPLNFFSVQCLREFLRGYVPPLSPAEEAAIAASQTPPEVINSQGVYQVEVK